MKKLIYLGLILVMMTTLGLAACRDVNEGANSGTAIPTFAPHSQPLTTRPPLLIQFCDDDTGSYPHGYFTAANQLIASSLQQAVTANQQGVTLYATAITHNTFDPANTLSPAFSIPSISAYPPEPTPVPTAAPQDPVTDPATATTIADQTNQNIANYNQQVAKITQQVQSTKASVANDAKRLTSWSPQVDDIGTSILGCFQLAASRFQGQPGTKLLYIASDLENNTDVDYTQNFVTSHALQGVIVHVIYFYSQNAARDQQKRSNWCPYLQSAGASAVFFSDPASSSILSDVFDKDLTASTSSC